MAETLRPIDALKEIRSWIEGLETWSQVVIDDAAKNIRRIVDTAIEQDTRAEPERYVMACGEPVPVMKYHGVDGKQSLGVGLRGESGGFVPLDWPDNPDGEWLLILEKKSSNG